MRPEFGPFFSLRRWLSIRKRSRQRVPQTSRSVLLHLEQLEDRITPTGPTITTLATFAGSNGSQPISALVMDSSGNLYGTALELNLGGGIFELPHGSNTIKTLALFPGDLFTGGDPVGNLLMDSSGNLYGTTTEIGGLVGGIIYELPHGSSTLKTLASFSNAGIGNATSGVIMDGSGNLYGTSSKAIYELPHGSSTITKLASFSTGNGSVGGLILDSRGNLYGASPGGGIGYGAVFELPNGSSTIKTLASLSAGMGSLPTGGVIMDSSGNLYGTAYNGGAYDDGTVFELPAGNSTINLLATFNSNTSGYWPWAGVIMDSSGNLFGTTEYGGAKNGGTVFELAHGSSTITTLGAFGSPNGANPEADLIMDGSGNLYGTTKAGGANDDGTIFEIQAVTSQPRLVFMQQPSNAVAGQTMPSITVAIEDQFGNIETSDNSGKIILGIGLGSPKGALNGTTTLTVSGGEATFSDLSINQVGSGYTLEASTNVNGVNSTYSNGFSISPAAPDHLVFLQGPTNVVAGATITPAVEVAIEDKFDNIEANDDTDTISLVLSPSGTLDGTKSQTVSGGVASFSDLSINQAANGYTLTATATSSGVSSLASSSFNIAPANVTTTAANVTANFSANAQTVTLNATVANASVPTNPVTEGIVTFTVMNGSKTLGSTTGTVRGGKVSANFSLPAALALGSYSIIVGYNDSQGNFIDKGDTNGTLAIVLLPTVTTNPSNQTAAIGGTVTFTAAANAYPPATVQWQLSTDDGKTFSDISGATSTTLTLNNVQASQNGDEYQAVFTNSIGTVTTAAAILTVPSAPIVTTPPSNQNVTAGQTATFAVVINGSPTPTVQWQVSTDGGSTWTNLSGAVSTTLTVSSVQISQNGYEYHAVLTNSLGTVTSPAASLTVQVAPIVKINPSNQTVTAYQTATFTAAASGNPAPSVQWQVSTDGGGSFSNISGATSTTLTLTGVTPAMSGYKYQAVFSNSAGSAVSSPVTLTVDTPPSSSQPITLNVPPLLALLGQLIQGVETVNANDTETVTYSLLGIVLAAADYDGYGNFVSATLFGFSIPNWVWFV